MSKTVNIADKTAELVDTNSVNGATITTSANADLSIGLVDDAPATPTYNTSIGGNLSSLSTGATNVAVGYGCLDGVTINGGNVAVGYKVAEIVDATGITAVGKNVLFSSTTGADNTVMGYQAAYFNTTGAQNTAMGAKALQYNSTTNDNTAIGYNCLNVATTTQNTAVGSWALARQTTGTLNTAMGYGSGDSITTGYKNVSMGYSTLAGSSAVYYNTAIGYKASSGTTGSNNVAIGNQSMVVGATGYGNIGVGSYTQEQVQSGTQNTAIGYYALRYNIGGDLNTACGKDALRYMQDGTNATAINNSTGLGYNARVSGDNQVQIGDSTTTTYTYGAVQNRSDERDKAEIRTTTLGLDFINKLRPVDFKWDYREDYIENKDVLVSEEREEVTTIIVTDAEGNETEEEKITTIDAVYENEVINLPQDGSKMRGRFHHGFIAQEVKTLIDVENVDFGGYQDHSLSGGIDVKSLGYEEFISPMVKAIQELTAKVNELEIKLQGV